MILRILTLTALLACTLCAHDIDFAVETAPNAVSVRFGYGPEDPARNAAVRVFSPADPANPFQTGATDQRGLFVFAPDRPGEWRVIVDDSEGHREEAKVTVAGDGTVTLPHSHSHGHDHSHSGRATTWLTGVSALLGITGITLWWSGRRRPGNPA
jgi:nickel transport protein